MFAMRATFGQMIDANCRAVTPKSTRTVRALAFPKSCGGNAKSATTRLNTSALPATSVKLRRMAEVCRESMRCWFCWDVRYCARQSADVHGGGKVLAVCSNHPSGVEEMVPGRTIDKKQGQPREENAGRQARDLGNVDTTDATPEEHTPGERTCTEKGSAGWGQIAKGNQCRNE
jgi:hypothetical protein